MWLKLKLQLSSSHSDEIQTQSWTSINFNQGSELIDRKYEQLIVLGFIFMKGIKDFWFFPIKKLFLCKILSDQN